MSLGALNDSKKWVQDHMLTQKKVQKASDPKTIINSNEFAWEHNVWYILWFNKFPCQDSQNVAGIWIWKHAWKVKCIWQW